MAHVRRRNDAWYIVHAGKEWSGRSFLGRPFTEQEARAYIPQVLLQAQADTLGGWLDQWLTLQRSALKETTWAGYERCCRRLPAELRKRHLGTLEVSDFERLYMAMLAEGLAPGTVRQTHAVLSKALDLAAARGKVPANPVRGATLPRVPEREYQTWDAAELRAFLAAARGDEWYALWLTAVTTGLRRGELLGLQPGDVFPTYLWVRRSVTWTGSRVVVTSPKTRHGRRQVALDDWTAEALQNVTVVARTWLWSEGEEPPDPHRLNRRFARLTRAAGLEPIRFHDLRHSHATAAMVAGAPLAAVTARLGHHDTAFTARVYQHADLTLQRAVAQQLAAPLFQNEKSPTLGEGGALSL